MYDDDDGDDAVLCQPGVGFLAADAHDVVSRLVRARWAGGGREGHDNG